MPLRVTDQALVTRGGEMSLGSDCMRHTRWPLSFAAARQRKRHTKTIRWDGVRARHARRRYVWQAGCV